jgi:Ulp1 family protease
MALVCFRESSLYKEDLVAIKVGWLTSNAIDFFFCLLLEKYESLLSARRIVLVSPATMFLALMSASEEDAAEIAEPLNLSKAEVVLFPLNNQSDMTSCDGSHWSLLVFERGNEEGRFLHYDSMRGSNKEIARSASGRENEKFFLKDISSF